MLKIVASVRRKPGMTHAEFVDYIVNVHGDIAKAVPLGLSRYVQNHVFDGSFGAADASSYDITFHRDSVTELFFATPEDIARTFSDEYTRTVVGPDARNFADISTNEATLTRETVLSAPAASAAGVKVMQVLVANEANGIEEAQAGWQQAHDRACAAAPAFANALCGTVRSDSLVTPPDGPVGAYFGGEKPYPVAVIASHWIGDADVGCVRAYDTALMGSGLFDPTRSYFLLTREVEIFAVVGGRAV